MTATPRLGPCRQVRRNVLAETVPGPCPGKTASHACPAGSPADPPPRSSFLSSRTNPADSPPPPQFPGRPWRAASSRRACGWNSALATPVMEPRNRVAASNRSLLIDGRMGTAVSGRRVPSRAAWWSRSVPVLSPSHASSAQVSLAAAGQGVGAGGGEVVHRSGLHPGGGRDKATLTKTASWSAPGRF